MGFTTSLSYHALSGLPYPQSPERAKYEKEGYSPSITKRIALPSRNVQTFHHETYSPSITKPTDLPPRNLQTFHHFQGVMKRCTPYITTSLSRWVSPHTYRSMGFASSISFDGFRLIHIVRWVSPHTYRSMGFATSTSFDGFRHIHIVRWVSSHTYRSMGVATYISFDGLHHIAFLSRPFRATLPAKP
jgi:hypothetical protein